MNKAVIKKFAIEARKKLMASVSDKAGMLGVTEWECSEPINKGADYEIYKTAAGTEVTLNKKKSEQRRILVNQIQERGYEAVIEEVAYTWFNRICAIRFMEINDYLPSRVRVLSSEKEGKNEPDLVTLAPDVDLDFTDREKEYIIEAKMNNKLDDLFRMLFIKQCNKLHEVLPELFEETEDYTEMLLSISFTNKDDIIYMLVNGEDGIPEADFNVTTADENGEVSGQVEIIGWLYQYYNTELKDDTFAKLKKNIKITKERIPAATQLFTPDWIVRYMVENSIGRLWIEHLKSLDPCLDDKETAERFGWKYYLPEAEQDGEVNIKLIEIRTSYKELRPKDIKCIDPCMGSGHILIAMFDVLMDIYKSAGYSEREAAFDIIENNIYGLDIDKRAYQLAYFAVMMKGRGYNRRLFHGRDNIKPEPKIYAVIESNNITKTHMKYFGNSLNSMDRNLAIQQMDYLLDVFCDAREYGSILMIENCNWDVLKRFVNELFVDGQVSFDSLGIDFTQTMLSRIINISQALCNKYECVITNPPYMALGGSSNLLSSYAKEHYPNSKSDLFAIFIEKCGQMTGVGKYFAMITQHSWMFLSSYEELRKSFLNYSIINMCHLGTRAFEEIGGAVVQTTAFVYRKQKLSNWKSKFVRLLDYQSQYEKEREFLNNLKKNTSVINIDKLSCIEGVPLAYWITDAELNALKNKSLVCHTISDGQNKTGDNNTYLREHWEVCSEDVGVGKKWLLYAKGGAYRKWAGNLLEVIDWSEAARKHYRESSACRILKDYLWYKRGITWGIIAQIGFRLLPEDATFDMQGSSVFLTDDDEFYRVIAFLNSKVAYQFLNIFNTTLSFQIRDIRNLPYIADEINQYKSEIESLAKKCIEISSAEWNSYETAWNYMKHPFIQNGSTLLAISYENWEKLCNNRFNELKKNEENLNRIFIEIYGLENDISPYVDEKDVSIKRAEKERDVKSFISYAVGCMFGRYSLDIEGIVNSGGNLSNDRYKTYKPKWDNIIPVTDEEYFENDIVAKFIEFVEIVYGKENIEENLRFISEAINVSGTTSREKLRTYFLKDFIYDHNRMYQKRPIYWLFDSGKENGFKAMIYMNRYNEDIVGCVRTEYLHKMQEYVEGAIRTAEYVLLNSSFVMEKSKATKLIGKYTKQLAETRIYDEAMAHIANKRVGINLDDGVCNNYQKFQNVEIAREGKKAMIVNLLTSLKI